MKQKLGAHSTSQAVRRELSRNYFFRKSISLGIANLSAVAEKVRAKLGGKPDAVKMAVMRFAREYREKNKSQESSALAILRKSKLTLISNVGVLIFEKGALKKVSELARSFEIYSAVESEKSTVVILGEESMETVSKKVGGLIKQRTNLCMLRITSPKEIEDVPGAMSIVLSTFAEYGINITDLYSCYTDTNIVIERKDALLAFEATDELLSSERTANKATADTH